MIETRQIADGTVDFTMMYVAHDAFIRDLRRLATACERGAAWSTRTQAGWAMFAEQLHLHHSTEDSALWPRLRAEPLEPDAVLIVDAMEREHAQLEPQLEHVEKAFADHDATLLLIGLQVLGVGLAAHTLHEESDTLPLVDRYLGADGWDRFGQEIRESQGGLKAGAAYLPWVLDGATPDMERKVLAQLPPPARVLYRRVWAPKYRRSNWWNGAVGT